MYIAWPNTAAAPIRQLVGIKREQMIAPLKAINVNTNIYCDYIIII